MRACVRVCWWAGVDGQIGALMATTCSIVLRSIEQIGQGYFGGHTLATQTQRLTPSARRLLYDQKLILGIVVSFPGRPVQRHRQEGGTR